MNLKQALGQLRWLRLPCPDGVRPSAAACALLASVFPALSQACGPLQRSLELGRQVAPSSWVETADNGGPLLKENGRLPAWSLEAALGCKRWSFSGFALVREGTRDYQGQTSLGVPLNTRSSLHEKAQGISASWAWLETFHLLVKAQNQRIERNIASTALASGYPESYRRQWLLAGARWTIPTDHGAWAFSAEKSVVGHQTMALQLPGKDVTALAFRPPRQTDLGLAWTTPVSNGFYLKISYHHIRTWSDRSDTAVVTSGGVPFGAAYQPRTVSFDRPTTLAVGWTY